jgi:starch-binding outer membrane protein, SusD/RagB family
MQLRNFLFLLSIPVLIATGCNKKLDVKPENEVTPEQIVTESDVKALVAGTYSSLQNSGSFGESYNTIPELLFADDELDFVGTFDTYADFYGKQQVAANGSAYSIWAISYRAINGVNLALSKLSIIEDADERVKVGGEAKFLRALVYFELVNFFAKPYDEATASGNPGVPLITAPKAGYDSTTDKLPRSSIADIYTQIIKDATEATTEMDQDPDVSDTKANKYAAYALLSRVYMAQHKYAEAADAANTVITDEAFSLVPSFANEFNNAANSSEDIFAIQQTSQSNAGTSNGGLTTFYSSYPIGRGDIHVTDTFVTRYEDGDDRKTFFYEGTSISSNDGLYTTKWRDLYKVIPVFRLAEMYLTRAEANFRNGSSIGATPTEDINVIRERAGLDDLVNVTEEDIINERHLELAFEGEWPLTVKRLNLPVGDLEPNTSDELVFPIPQREIDIKSGLPQNPGY